MNSERTHSESHASTVNSSAEEAPKLWRRSEPVGYGIGLTSFATFAAPLLAGFSLTTIVTLSGTLDNRGTRGDIAIAAFSVATVLMLFTLQAGLVASQRAIPPDQRASLHPEARHYGEWMRRLRSDQWRDEKLAWGIYVRCRWTYNLGIIAFIGGLIALLIPNKWDDPHPGPVFRIIAFVVAIIAILIEIALTLGKPTRLSNWLIPGFAGSKPVKLKDVEEMKALADEEAQRLAFGDYGSNIGDAATIVATIRSVLGSLATHLAELDQAVEGSVRATTSQAKAAEDQAALVREGFPQATEPSGHRDAP
jgi:MFS family permease